MSDSENEKKPRGRPPSDKTKARKAADRKEQVKRAQKTYRINHPQ